MMFFETQYAVGDKVYHILNIEKRIMLEIYEAHIYAWHKGYQISYRVRSADGGTLTLTEPEIAPWEPRKAPVPIDSDSDIPF
jgi:hypothetical protein